MRFQTATGSVHQVDLTAGTYVRLRQGSDSGELRRDGEVMPLVMATITVGAPAVLLLRLREDGVLTKRITSPVVWVADQ